MKKITRKWITAALAAAAAVSLTACGSGTNTQESEAGSSEPVVVKVGVVGEYNAQWDTINELLADDGIQVELVKFTDYAAPNRALDDGEIDLNAFQHKAYKISSIEDIKDGDVIAIPSDLTNGGRALKLLEAAGLIECDPAKGVVPTKADITKYNTQIEIMEAESATLANILPDCAAAIINGGNAFTAGLNPLTDTIFVEDVNPETNPAVPDLVNVIVARTEDKDNETYLKIVEAYHTAEVQETIEEEYQGAFVCAWEGAE